MRFLIFIIIVLLLAYAWWPQQEPLPIEETFIGDQIAPLRKTEKFKEEEYIESLDEYRKRLDVQENAEGS